MALLVLQSLFYRCFREGDPAWKYERLFATTEKRIVENPDGTKETVYLWELTQGGGAAFEVAVGSDGYQDVVLRALVVWVWSH